MRPAYLLDVDLVGIQPFFSVLCSRVTNLSGIKENLPKLLIFSDFRTYV